MFLPILQHPSFSRLIGWAALFSFIFTSPLSPKIFANNCWVYEDAEDEQRAKRARILVGATVVALIGGAACLAFGVGQGRCHSSHHHSCYSSSYSGCRYSSWSPSSSDSSWSGSGSGSSSHSHSSSSTSIPSIFTTNTTSSFGSSPSEQLGPQLSPESHGLVRSKWVKKRSKELSGVFRSHAVSSAKGSFTAFVHLPDGTTETLGLLSFGPGCYSSIPYGPFDQVGTYAFGIRINEGTVLPSHAKVGSFEVKVNRSTVQSGDFFIASHPPAYYEPSYYYYELEE